VGIDRLCESCDVQVWPMPAPIPRDALLTGVKGCDAVLSVLTERIDDQLFDAAGPQLRVVSNFAVGVDNIDLEAATRRGIPVGNTPGVLTETTADLAWALMMAAARRVVEGDRFVREGQWHTWDPNLLLGVDVYGATLGIVGFGRIGQAVARRAQGFGMRVLLTNRSPVADPGDAEPVGFDDLLAQSDFVSIHVPLTPHTRGLFDTAAFARMKEGSVLVNTARGPIVDPRALYGALVNGPLAAAALDVTDPEPIPLDDPLLTLPNCVVIPHLGSASIATRDKMATIAAENILAGIRGARLPFCANPGVYGPLAQPLP